MTYDVDVKESNENLCLGGWYGTRNITHKDVNNRFIIPISCHIKDNLGAQGTVSVKIINDTTFDLIVNGACKETYEVTLMLTRLPDLYIQN